MKISWEASEVIKTHNLLQMGLSYQDLHIIPYDEADKLLLLQKTIKEVEDEEIDKQKGANPGAIKQWQS